ncbi:AtpZ/AtpI family protein [Paracrocinitomix mangrovi]|uniref:AtpZ/AtpI family protein n=1 Tax=Paracrocinitomix mangrovi TaxID=2862509 RepID=UPI001C8EFA40|nr:AtpZ/AtpI family protein [Paracrocinitomix mangrovi]UKN00369.1 AtpZ/AtpI family protein [Paracrocinitomix mangrovi]
MKYSGMAFQMLATIGLGAYGGHLLDQNQQTEKPVWTILFAALGTIVSLVLVIRSVKKMSDED